MVRTLSLVSAAGRIAIGAGLLAAPRLSLRTLGFGDESRSTVAVAQLAGIRDLVLGLQIVAAAGDGQRLRTAQLAAAAADAGDTAVFAVLLAGDDPPPAAVRGLAAALPAALGGFWVASRLDSGSAQI